MELNHGGDWAGFQEKYGKLPLDFSASTTPLPMPEEMRAAVIRSLDRADHYPDPLCRELTAALEKKHRLPPEHILCGAGAADLLFRLVLAKRPRRAMIVEPTFSGYEEALQTVNCQIERLFLRGEDGFTLTEDILPCIKPGLDMLFLCSPNNPTGRSVPTELLEKIRERCRQRGTLLVLDACFGDFLPGPPQDGPFVLRSFTKWYPMAGLRLGYAVCPDTELDRELEKKGILIRSCSNFPGLGPGWYRAAVRTGEENQALLRAMKEAL